MTKTVTITYADGAVLLITGVRGVAKIPSGLAYRTAFGEVKQDWFPPELQLTGLFGVIRLSTTHVASVEVRTNGGVK